MLLTAPSILKELRYFKVVYEDVSSGLSSLVLVVIWIYFVHSKREHFEQVHSLNVLSKVLLLTLQIIISITLAFTTHIFVVIICRQFSVTVRTRDHHFQLPLEI